MKNKFIKITCVTMGAEFDLLVNVNEIIRLTYDVNRIEFKTPFPGGSTHIGVTQKEFDRLEKFLLGASNGE